MIWKYFRLGLWIYCLLIITLTVLSIAGYFINSTNWTLYIGGFLLLVPLYVVVLMLFIDRIRRSLESIRKARHRGPTVPQ